MAPELRWAWAALTSPSDHCRCCLSRRLADTVTREDIAEARRLLTMSKASLDAAAAGQGAKGNDEDHVNRVYNIIRRKVQDIEVSLS